MTKSEWIQLLVPLLSVIAAIISAALSYYFTKKLQIISEEKKLKEKYYQDYINAISKVAIDNFDNVATTELANSHNTITLIGSARVVQLAMQFHTYIVNCQKTNMPAEEHDVILTNLIKAMREDLYNKKSINNGYPIIHLSGRGSRGKRK